MKGTFFLVVSGFVLAAQAGAIELRDVAVEAGVSIEIVCGSSTAKRFILEQNGSGAALFDYDFDGDLDLYLVNGASPEILRGEAPAHGNALYRNDGGWRFVDVTALAGVGDTSWGMGVAVADIDRDGDDDLYVTNYGPNLLYENLGEGRFREIGEIAGVADDGWGHSAAFGDIDRDGDLDLYVTNNLLFDFDRLPKGGLPCDYRGVPVACGPIGFPKQPDRLYRNDGGLRFTDVSASSGIHNPDPEHGLGVVFGDLDEDHQVDIFVANDSGPNFFFHGLGKGRFEERAWLAGLATQNEGRYQAGMGATVGEANGDGRPDLFLTHFARDHNTLYSGQGEGFFSDDSYSSALGTQSWPRMGWGTRFVDLDHDGDQDLYVANGHIYPEIDAGLADESFAQEDSLYLNDGKGLFEDASSHIHKKGGPGVSRGVAFGDLDQDGDIDLLVVEIGSSPTLLRTEDVDGHYLQVALHGRDSAPDGAGARLELQAGDRGWWRQATRSGSYLSSAESSLHFGLETSSTVDSLDVHWPQGKKQRFEKLPADRKILVFE